MNRNRQGKYSSTDHISNLITENYSTLLVLSRFRIPLGFGDKTIDEVCIENKVDTDTFLTIINLLLGNDVDPHVTVSLQSMMDYLHNSHNYFLQYRLPGIRVKLVEVLQLNQNKLNKVVLGYFDEYVSEVNKHMMYEEDTVFPYVRELIEGKQNGKYNIHTFSKQHDQVEMKLTEFKNILIKYYPLKSSNELNSVLFDIFTCEKDLAFHNEIEDRLFVPTILKNENNDDLNEALTARERDVIICVARGLTNKQIADQLCVSMHTIITHRRNIAAKLDIRSTAGLTIYAIVNKLIDLEDL